MDEKCNNCMNNNIDCDVIKQLRKDVLKIKVNRSCLHIIALLICSLGFMVAGLFAFRTFFPISTAKNMVYNIQISGNVSGEISAEIKKELAEALIEVENRAVAAYNEKFTILLTILTIFGIAWPLVVAMLQLRFNEGELKKIKEAEEKANAANELAKNMKDQMKDVTQKTNDLQANYIAGQLVINEVNKVKHDLYSELPSIYFSLSIFHSKLPANKSFTTLDHYKVAVLMLLNRFFYCCANEFAEEKDIVTYYKDVMDGIKEIDSRIKSGETVKHQYNETLFEDFDWNVIEQRLKPAEYTELKELCDKVFLAKGEK
ncbi:MAG: hypothetical protein IJW17_08260 [Lentisphaeria bacterium]|nr:hypothetical protein [Lentisphaeria bacterium]